MIKFTIIFTKIFTTIFTIIFIWINFFSSIAFTQERLVVGKTYDIKERNALEEIKERAEKIDMKKVYLERKNKWIDNVRVSPLPTATVDKTRAEIPWGVAPKDIVDKHGKLLYQKGFKFNPLKWLKMTFRVFVINEEHLDWVKPQLKPMDRVILNMGNLAQAREKLGRDVFILDEPFQQKMRVEKVPSIISQENEALQIQEVFTGLNNENN
ncbi:MAG: hypothetical protein HRT38_04100 [Alteromonadaceae bacterium]|nr:hypothetical protein [Alteromonadaceae bacterium]